MVQCFARLLPLRVRPGEPQSEHNESASTPKSEHERDRPGRPLRAKKRHERFYALAARRAPRICSFQPGL
jgi:hypothetical protein